MKLTPQQQLMQEALFGRVHQVAQQLQQNPPQQKQNPLTACTAAFAAANPDDNEVINAFVTGMAFAMMNEQALSAAIKDVQELKNEIKVLKELEEPEELAEVD